VRFRSNLKGELSREMGAERGMLGENQGLSRQAGITGARNGRVIIKILPGHFGRWNGGLVWWANPHEIARYFSSMRFAADVQGLIPKVASKSVSSRVRMRRHRFIHGALSGHAIQAR